MATPDQVTEIRNRTDEPVGSSSYSDLQLMTLIDEKDGDLDLVARQVWLWKAAKYSSLVTTSESGSSRALSDLYKNALAMAGQSGDGGGENPPYSRPSRTRAIERL
jgi:hypothetical protein